MATILSDTELRKLFGSVIMDADESCLRPNSYILRLGSVGEFITTEKRFKLGDEHIGIKIPPGHSVGITAREKIDFSRDTVHKIFADSDLHGILSPTTDLSREGIIAPTTQIDAGYTGTINWTINNTSHKEAKFIYEEKLFRLTIFRLEKGETPKDVYDGTYHKQEGYVPSKRSGAPVGMRDSEWINPYKKSGPEKKLEELAELGYPWNIFSPRFKILDGQIREVSKEYGEIRDSMKNMEDKINSIESRQQQSEEKLRGIIREEIGNKIEFSQSKKLSSFIIAFSSGILVIIVVNVLFEFIKKL